jgi:hypothetical protein
MFIDMLNYRTPSLRVYSFVATVHLYEA